MTKLILFILAVGTICYSVYWYRAKSRLKAIHQMSVDELVEAVIKREISILEVPKENRNSVNSLLEEIQSDLDEK